MIGIVGSIPRKFIALVVTVIFAAALAAGCGGGGKDGAAGRSKTLTIYTALNENEIGTYFKGFESKTGIQVSFVRLSAGEIITRLKAEKNNPRASVVFGGPSDTFIAMAKDGLLEPYKSPASASVPDQFKDKGGYWTPLYIGILGFGTNVQLAEKKGIKPPESWEDLLKPEFKGLVSIAHPGSSGTSYTVLASLVQLWGEDKAFDYLKKLNANVRTYEKAGAAPAQQAGLGEALVGICFSHDILIPMSEGFPLKLTFPQEGTGYEIGGMALVKNGPAAELDNAKLFLDFFAGKDGQELYEAAKTFRLPVNPDTKVPKGAVRLSDIKTIKYDNVWAGENRARLVDKFIKTVVARP